MADDDDKELGVSRKIMIAAIFSLIGVVMLILCLHLYSRYLQRLQERRRRAAIYRLSRQIEPEIASEQQQQPKVGLDPLVIASIPAFKYFLQLPDHGEAIECSVCLSTVAEDAMVRILPNCKHMFHVECIDMWLGSHTTCPICRTVAEPEERVVQQPSAPPLQEGNTSRNVPEMEKGSGSSGSRFGSFRWMVSRDRSSRTRSCGDEICAQDLERQ